MSDPSTFPRSALFPLERQPAEAHDRFKSELWRIGHLGDKPRRTWNDAVVRRLKALITKQVGKHATRVFSYKGKPIIQVSTKVLVRGAAEGRHRRFSLARSAADLDELARAERHAVVRVAGARWLGLDGDGAALMRISPRIIWRRTPSGWRSCAPEMC